MATTALYTEINHVINTFGAPFFQLLAVRAAPVNIVLFVFKFITISS
jgi:exportin-2 (importin alpha re-exporter)